MRGLGMGRDANFSVGLAFDVAGCPDHGANFGNAWVCAEAMVAGERPLCP